MIKQRSDSGKPMKKFPADTWTKAGCSDWTSLKKSQFAENALN